MQWIWNAIENNPRPLDVSSTKRSNRRTYCRLMEKPSTHAMGPLRPSLPVYTPSVPSPRGAPWDTKARHKVRVDPWRMRRIAAFLTPVLYKCRRHRKTKRQSQKAQAPQEKDEEKSLEEKFNDFTTVLPWFGFAADIQQLHAERRTRAREAAEGTELQQRLRLADRSDLCNALRHAYEKNPAEMPEVVEAVLQYAEATKTRTEPTKVIDDLCGRWEAVWSGAFTPLQKFGIPRQSLWVEVTPGKDGDPPIVTAHSGLPLVLFGAYLWTSCAGDLLPAESASGSQVLIQFTRYWIDIGREPRPDIGRVDGGFINSRLSAFGAALVTPVLLEFGALKWLLERFGFQRVFEVEVPSPEKEKTVKLQASLELYLTLLARVAFPDSLSTCPVPFLDVKEGLCVYEIPMLGPLGDLPLHPGGNSATLVARKLAEDEPVQLMR
ncbi:unnamed protein product [Durusdinium trenchii]|uniref:Uncharacterized protein n=2 Tax=Durusdinium trenchii TaxID=1381693 RepID=A0ABP0HMT8_9DINO